MDTSSCSPPFLMDQNDDLATEVNEQVSVAGEMIAGNAETGEGDEGVACRAMSLCECNRVLCKDHQFVVVSPGVFLARYLLA